MRCGAPNSSTSTYPLAVYAGIAAYDGDDVATYRRDLKQFAQFPDWLRLGMLPAAATWDSSDPARKCPHDPQAWQQQPVHAAAWRPDFVVCDDCFHLLGTADRCDACGAEQDDERQLELGVIRYDMFTYHFATCADCRFEA